jgi:hypothetical protein
MVAVILMDNEILEQQDEAPLRRRDGEQQINHGHNPAILPQDKDASAAGLLEDEAQPAHLLGAFRLEVAFQSEEVEKEFRELRKIVNRGRLDGNVLHLKRSIWHKHATAGRDFSQSGKKDDASRGAEP